MRPILATLLSGLLVLSAMPPQTPRAAQTPPPAAPKGGFKFATTTQLVVVDVTVKDKSGNPIRGLKPADFNITEDGKKQDIKIFTYQELEETVTPPEPVPAKAPTPAPAPDAPATPVAPIVKAVTANQIAPSRPGEVKYKDRRLLVMFFDMTSMPINDQIRAQTAAQKFLKTQMTPSDLMAIMTFSSDLKVLQDFTDDRDALARVVKGLTIGEGSDLAVDGATGADNEEDTGAAYTADDRSEEHTSELQSLRQLVCR